MIIVSLDRYSRPGLAPAHLDSESRDPVTWLLIGGLLMSRGHVTRDVAGVAALRWTAPMGAIVLL